ncbi:hypothetical protein KGQ19_00675 [Catenulispora sp. NL8]|uniref:Type II secretion system protein n=1 Tax=Catenulispora pinistramenti TaxID=2705254 RepID=A0ABS5KGH1_9ACTN|nr:hypothetical protein [Catenulispora pinistramenti]MBS2545373.1 hypothetical protein [Catenulispora pinistramenti]
MIPLPYLGAGCVAGLGLAVLTSEFLPAPPKLTTALDRMRQTTAPQPTSDDRGLRMRFGAWLAERADGLPGLTVPVKDLAILNKPRELWFFDKIGSTVLVLLGVPYAMAMFYLIGFQLPPVLALVIAVVGAAVAWFGADYDLAARARKARREFDWALASYLDLVALRRLGDAAAADALQGAAELGEGWVFVRLREALHHARLERVPPWDGLRKLADEVGAGALRDVADIMSWSGSDGASVYTALRARTKALRVTLGNAQAEDAAAATVRLTMIGAFLALVLMILIGYPAFSRILST